MQLLGRMEGWEDGGLGGLRVERRSMASLSFRVFWITVMKSCLIYKVAIILTRQ